MAVTLKQLLSAYNGYLGARLAPAQIQAYGAELAQRRTTGWYSRVPRVGDRLPELNLPGLGSTRELLRNGPLILKFFRSHLCPFCMLEIKAYQRICEQLGETQLIAITSDQQAVNQTGLIIEDLDFPIVHDEQASVACALGIAYESGSAERAILESLNIQIQQPMTLPAVFAVNRDGVIVFAFTDADPSQRAEPDVVVASLNAHEKHATTWSD